MKAILSTGQGRLHLVQSATYVEKQGVEIVLVQGWVPKKPESWLVQLLAIMSGNRNLAAGFKKRRPDEFKGKIQTCAFSEYFIQFLFLISKKTGLVSHSTSARWGWQLFGWQTKKYMKDGDIFHVRSGAGQGGAITEAKQRGMKVVVDQSALHPDAMKANTQKDYEKWGMPSAFGADIGVWRLVIKDCRDADVILVNSEHVKRSFVDKGWAPDKIAVAYIGVREDFFGIKNKYRSGGKLTLLFTGGFSVLKGAEYIYEMLKILKERKVVCVMKVVGSTHNAQKLIDFYEKELLPIEFGGHVPQEQLKSFLSEADIYVFPSLADGCASSGMEAMAAGLCIVTTPESGLPIIDGDTGYLVPSKDAVALADKVEWLSKYPENIERAGRSAAQLIREKYTWDQYAKKILTIYEECRAIQR